MSLTESEWNRFSGAEEEAAEELRQAHSPQRDGELTWFRGGVSLTDFLNPI